MMMLRSFDLTLVVALLATSAWSGRIFDPFGSRLLALAGHALNAGRATVNVAGASAITPAAEQQRGNVILAADCEQLTVQSAINSASAGDTVMVPAGECTWNAAVSILDKTITLLGAGTGTGGSKIIYGETGHSLLEIDPGSKTGKMDISGFWFVGGDPDYWSGTAISFGGPKGWKNLRIHHNVFEDNVQWTIVGYAGTHGVIDHNTFKGSAHGIVFYGDGAEDWATSLTLGTADFFFVEDNVFDWDDWYGATGAACMDMQRGGRVVFRYNTVMYGFWETHDKARSGLASANAYEIYNNKLWTNTNKWKGLDISAGSGVVWGNTFTGGGTWETDWSVPIGAMDYKSFDPRGLPLCDGNDPADQNVPGEAGWRCQYQIGSQSEGPTAYAYPLYLWSNYHNSSLVGMECTAGCSVNSRPHLLEGRDFINNGTTIKPGYTPYAYPHLLIDDIGSMELTLNGTPANQAIYLTWDVAGTLPVTTTWTIDYEGLPGDQIPPITSLAESTRSYTLTGLTNYTWYTVTLTTDPPMLTDTVTVMPTDLMLFMPLVVR